MSLKKIVHVNQHVIAKNQKYGLREPVLSCKTYKDNDYGHEVILKSDDGLEVGRFIYRPDKPLSCGARVWFETTLNTEIVNNSPEGM